MTSLELGPIATGISLAILTGNASGRDLSIALIVVALTTFTSKNALNKQLPMVLIAGAVTKLGCAIFAKALPSKAKIRRAAKWIKPATRTYAEVKATIEALRKVGLFQ